MPAKPTKAPCEFACVRLIPRLGATVWRQWDDLRHAAAVIGTVLCVCVQPRYWTRTIRKAFALQILSVGVEPLWFVGTVAVFVGISVVVQLTFWVGETGQSQLLGPLLVTVVARELGPVLINLVVIVRSGSAMTTELGVL
jgi:phospholipid/cholesterol/gamma-HCH transport system permease protein